MALQAEVTFQLDISFINTVRMKKLILSLSLLLVTSVSFSQSYDKPRSSATEQVKKEQVVVENNKPLFFNFALKLNPLSIINSPSLWYKFNIEASIPKIPRTSLYVSFGKNVSPGVNFQKENIFLPGSTLSSTTPNYIYSEMLIRAKKGFTNEIGLRHYIPLKKNYLSIEGISIGAFYSLRNSKIDIKEDFASGHYSHPQYILTGGQIEIQHYEKFYGAELGFQKAFGKKKQFVFNVDAGYGKKMITNIVSASGLQGPGLTQKFVNENKMAVKANIGIGLYIH